MDVTEAKRWMKDYLNLVGKTAIVTGAGRGIGAAIAQAFCEYGVKVILCDVNDQDGRSLQKKLIQGSVRAEYFHCDVTDQQEVDSLITETLDLYGSIDILVNNAGIGAISLPFETISDQAWAHMLDVDLTGPFRLCRSVVPVMKKQHWGKIVNISSGSGIIGCEFCAHYAAAKAGLIGFTQSIAKELAADHINVNAIAVPTTDTPMLRETQFDSDTAEMLSSIPWGRIGTPKDVADMTLYLCSDASEYVTGQVLAPNGGRRTPI